MKYKKTGNNRVWLRGMRDAMRRREVKHDEECDSDISYAVIPQSLNHNRKQWTGYSVFHAFFSLVSVEGLCGHRQSSDVTVSRGDTNNIANIHR